MMLAPQTANCRIVVEGVLDPMWLECLGGLEMTEQRQPAQPIVTGLEGRLVDQSALQGVLDTLCMLGMRLITVECLQSARWWFNALGDRFVNGVVIGIGSTLDVLTEVVIALSMALSTGPLAFVAIPATRQGMMAEHRRLVGRVSVAVRWSGRSSATWCSRIDPWTCGWYWWP
jgi:hypothetical protein